MRRARDAVRAEMDDAIPWGIDLPEAVHKRLDGDFDLFLILDAIEGADESRAHRLADQLGILCRGCGAPIDSVDVLNVIVDGDDPRASEWECDGCEGGA